MVKSTVVGITPSTHAASHIHGAVDPLTGDVRIDSVTHATSHIPGGADEVAVLNTLGVEMRAAATRVEDTIYQNTSNTVLFVSVSGYYSGGTHYVYAYVEDATPPTKLVAGNTGSANERVCVTVPVPPGFYYKMVYDPRGSPDHHTWYEWT